MMTDGAEMQRRWDLILSAMDKQNIDCLFMYSTDRIFSAYLRYVTDYPTILYPLAGLFSHKGISIFGHGAMGDDLYPPPTESRTEEDGKFHFIAGGVAVHDFVLDATAVPCAPTTIYAPDQLPMVVAGYVKKYGYKTIGLVGLNIVPYSFIKYFQENLPGIDLVDATDLVDDIKAVKSPYELKMAVNACRMVDQLMMAAPTVMKVGLSIREIGRKLRALADTSDCMDLNIMLGKHPTMPIIDSWEFTDDVIVEKIDCIVLMVVVSNNVGFWSEVGRVYAMGEPPEELIETNRAAFDAENHLATLMKPGAVSNEVFDRICKYLVSKGFPAEKRFIAHGQGYDVVEMPMIRPENPCKLKKDMFVAIHPSVYIPKKKTGCFVCDNYVITENGAERVTQVPQEIIKVYNHL
jgi:Xaa-Pro aminopeptidase